MAIPEIVMVEKRRIAISLFFGLIAEVFNKIAPLIVIHFAQDRLGLQRFGFAQFGMTLIDVASLFVVFGYTNLAMIEMGKAAGDRLAIAKVMANITTLKLINAVVVSAILIGAISIFPAYKEYQNLVLILSCFLFTSALDMMYVHTGTQRMAAFSILTIIAKLISMAAVLMLVHSPDDAELYAFLTVGISGMISLGTFFLSTQRFFLTIPHTKDLIALFQKSRPYALNLILHTVLTRFDMFLVEHFHGAEGAGLYAGPLALTKSIISLALAMAMVFFSESLIARSKEEVTSHVRLAIWVSCAALFPLCVGIWFVDGDILRVIVGENFYSAGRTLSILMVSAFLHNLLWIFGFQVLLTKGRIALANFSLAAGGMVGILTGILAGPVWGLNGVAGSVAAGYLVAGVLSYSGARREILAFPFQEIIKTAVPALLMGAVLLFIKDREFYTIIAVGVAVYALAFTYFNRSELMGIRHSLI